MKLSWLPWRRKVSLREAEDRRPSPGERQVAQVTPSPVEGVALIPPDHRPDLEDQLSAVTDLAGFLALERALGEAMSARRRFEADLVPESARPFTLPGHCIACGDRREFTVGFEYATGVLPDGRTLPNWREHLICRGCGLNNRMRAALHVLQTRVDLARDQRIYITESTTALYRWLSQRYPQLVGSEYLGAELRPGSRVQGVRHEDVTRLTFEDEAFDVILSFDVFEHVPDYRAGFREICRCLRPGGSLVFTVPFIRHAPTTLVRARVREDGGVDHVLPAEYHGDPVNPAGGILCYYHFGWDMLDELRAAGFSSAAAMVLWSIENALLGPEQLVFVASR